MEDNIQEPVVPVQIEETKRNTFSYVDPRTNMKGFLLFLLAFVIVLGFGTVATSGITKTKTPPPVAKKSTFQPIAPYTIVYGYWTGAQKSVVNGLDLNSGEITNIAELPFDIKKVDITSPNNLLFINKTDLRDHGKEIASFNISKKEITTLVKAADGFGIDDYVLSPNKKYIALWEVIVPDNSDLSFGKSRVYVVDLTNAATQNLVYDEYIPTTKFAHYPIAVTDSGEVLMDTFRPNNGVGWANGMSYAPFGGSPVDISSMQAGTYSTQPQVSSDGRYLVFAGYDGSAGDGNAVVGGYRRAILIPNTLNIFDIAKKERTTLPGISNQSIYPHVSWDSQNQIIYSMLPKSDPALGGQYLYDLATRTSSLLQANDSSKEGYNIISSIGNGKYLSGQYDNSSTALGNLGETYLPTLSSLAIFNKIDKTDSPLDLGQGLVQYVGLLPGKYFAGGTIIGNATFDSSREKQLQLKSFAVKPQLEIVRKEQQSDPPPPPPVEETPGVTPTPTPLLSCMGYNIAQCNALLGTNISESDFRGSSYTRTPEMIECVDAHDALNPQTAGLCSDSPLYMYGEKGKNVSVSINTAVSNSNAPYNNGYKGTLTGDGGVKIGNKVYSSLEYDYNSAIKKLLPPEYGETVRVSKVGETIRMYGQKLGLNSKEIEDTINGVEGKLTSKYVFVSFYDEEISKAILPITFEPQPDVYRNIVFYFKQVDKPTVSISPKFKNYPSRTGFTAVEVSYIIQ